MEQKFDRIPVKKAFLWIFLSVVAISGTATFGWLYYLHWKESWKTSSKYQVRKIAQTSPDLPASFFAEELGLAVDSPANLYALSQSHIEKRLREHPIIKEVHIEKQFPSTLLIDAKLRKPIAIVGDFTHLAMDLEGVLIPLEPFFSSRNLPILYLGLEQGKWGERVDENILTLCHHLFKEFLRHRIAVKSLDVSRLEASSAGQREIIVELEKDLFLRLNPRDPLGAVSHYVQMEKSEAVSPSSKIIDLRIKNLAFIVNDKKEPL